MTLFACIHYIMLATIKTLVTESIGNYLESVFQIILSHDTVLDNVMIRLQEFANKFALNLYICTIDKNGRQFDDIKTTTVHQNGISSYAFIVFDKRYQNFYSFYVSDTNNKNQTVFSMKDTYTLQLFGDLVSTYDWPSDGEKIQQSPGQHTDEGNISTVIDSRSTGLCII